MRIVKAPFFLFISMYYNRTFQRASHLMGWSLYTLNDNLQIQFNLDWQESRKPISLELFLICCMMIVIASASLISHCPIFASVKLALGRDVSDKVFVPGVKAYGLTYSEWTAKWWQWYLSIPSDITPTRDTDGRNCNIGQSGPVWFLVGTEVPPSPVTRTCSIPMDKAILFPIINTEESFIESPSLHLESELRNDVRTGIDMVTNLDVEVDGNKIPDLKSYRFASPLFNFTFPENNTSGVPAGPSQAISDGYWIMLKPLSLGKHNVHFRGEIIDFTATSYVNFIMDVTYHLIVTSH